MTHHADQAPTSHEAPVADLAGLQARIAELQAENARLLRLLTLSPQQARPPGPTQTGWYERDPGPVTDRSSPDQKVAFFAGLFAARADVYATRWENTRLGKAGWSPAVRGGWRKGIRRHDQEHLPLTPEVLRAHLRGEIHLGLYPLLDGDTTWWLAADFDGHAAMLDALAYVKAARARGVPAALEVSRSGLGAHVWIFFTAPVPAETARRLGTALLREAMAVRGRMDLSSYDRLFPSQDVLPAGGMGNLIAAPLQRECRARGATVFLDLATMEPHEDQWDYLSSLSRMTPLEAGRIARSSVAITVGREVKALARATSTKIHPAAPATIKIQLGAGITIDTTDLPPALIASLKHAASMANPEFYARQRRRASTWDAPRFLRSYDETLDGHLVLPRGLLDTVTTLTGQAGSRLDTNDARAPGTAHEFTFTAVLSPAQRAAVDALTPHDLGILQAPPGSGKTVMACAVIAAKATSTLILVERTPLAEQWRRQVMTFLAVKTGQLGAGRAKLRHTIDIMTLQTLARRTDVPGLTAGYGLIVVDECHHVPAAAFEHAVQQIGARHWLGLTATPYRRDQLDELITHQLGPVRHILTTPRAPGTADRPELDLGNHHDMDGTGHPPRPVLKIHPTAFTLTTAFDASAPGAMAAVHRALARDDNRTRQVLDDALAALAARRNCLILTLRTDHLERFATLLRDNGHDPVVLRGGLSAKARAAALARLRPDPDGPPLIVVATGSYAGEGFDCPALDTLFLAAPIAQKGRLVQAAGRILRTYPGKNTAEVHDYHDEHVGVLASSLAKRTPGYTSLGFTDPRRANRRDQLR
jgi:superfamily II DNA or RNA helicase